MYFGVNSYPFYTFPDLRSLVAFVQQAEHLGFDYVCIPEHIAFDKEYERTMGSTWWHPTVLASHLADKTDRIRFLFYVLVLPQHNVFYLARELATLDHISGGRISVGVGVGWLKREMELLGADFHRRGALTDEYVAALRALWTKDPASFEGKTLSFSNLSCLPMPVQKPCPPIFIGGGANASPERAARIGDGWIPMGVTFEEFKQGLSTLKTKLTEFGRPVNGFPVVRLFPFFARNAMHREHAIDAGGSDVGGFDGDPQKTLEHIEACAALGVTHMTVELPNEDPNSKMHEMERFAVEVLAKVRSRKSGDRRKFGKFGQEIW